MSQPRGNSFFDKSVRLGRFAWDNRQRIKDAVNQLKGIKIDSAITSNLKTKKSAVRRYLDKNYERKCGVEVKRIIDTSTYALTTTFASLSGNITLVAQGVGETQRVGSSFELKSYTTRMLYQANATAIRPTFCRLLLVKYGKNQGTTPGGGTILDTTTNILTPRTSVTDKAVMGDYTIVKEVNFTLAPYGQSGSARIININYRPKGCHEVKYTMSDTAGALANTIEGSLVLYGFYEGTSSPTNPVSYNMLEWVDI